MLNNFQNNFFQNYKEVLYIRDHCITQYTKYMRNCGSTWFIWQREYETLHKQRGEDISRKIYEWKRNRNFFAILLAFNFKES